MKTQKRVFVFLAFLVLLSPGCESQKAKVPVYKVSVQLKWIHQAQFAGFYIAEKKGFYAAENIHISLSARYPTMSIEKLVTGLANGNSNFTVLGGDELLIARANGEPIVA